MSSVRKGYCVFGCAKMDAYMHGFPHPERRPDMFQKWVLIVGDKLKETDPMKIYKNKKICAHHFTSEQKVASHRLTVSAVPTLHLDGVFLSSALTVQLEHNYCIPGISATHSKPNVSTGILLQPHPTAVPIDEDPPIMLLLKRLISNDNKQNTILTNAQIIGVLQKEFNMDISTLHELELDIYLNITRKFLEDWPQWDEFDRVINRLKSSKAHASVKKVLDHRYKKLKEYLSVMLEATKREVRETMQDIMKESEVDSPSTSKGSIDTSDILMEVTCTREQLNQLFFRNPNTDMSTSCFNNTENSPSRIILHAWNLESILNMWRVKIKINSDCLTYKRETVHKLKHVLINKKHSVSLNRKTILNDQLQMKLNKGKEFQKQTLFDALDQIALQYTNNIEVYVLLDTVFRVIKSDFIPAPENMIPGAYRQHSNKHSYVRYLHADSSSDKSETDEMKYDLQLEETVSPMHQFFLGKVEISDSVLPPFRDWFELECGYCEVRFVGFEVGERLKAHFEDYHQNEPDWECTHCGKRFETKYLAERKWHHSC